MTGRRLACTTRECEAWNSSELKSPSSWAHTSHAATQIHLSSISVELSASAARRTSPKVLSKKKFSRHPNFRSCFQMFSDSSGTVYSILESLRVSILSILLVEDLHQGIQLDGLVGRASSAEFLTSHLSAVSKASAKLLRSGTTSVFGALSFLKDLRPVTRQVKTFQALPGPTMKDHVAHVL